MWSRDSIVPAVQYKLLDYLLKTLPRVKGSLQHNYGFEQAMIRCAVSTDKRLRIWTLDASVAEAGEYLTIAEFETTKGPRVRDLTIPRKEYELGQGGWCDTVYSVTSKDGITFYLPVTHFAADRDYVGTSIENYNIVGSSLRSGFKLFSAKKKQLSGISYSYSWGNSNDRDSGIPQIRMNNDGKTILIPLVKDDYVTNSNLRYEFDGKKFVFKGVEK
jgi:hypothetical protein